MTLSTDEALEEWRAARQAIFDAPTDLKVTPELFTRLGHAENSLMEIARKASRDGEPLDRK